MSFSEEVVSYLEQFPIGKNLTTREIIDGVHSTYRTVKGSIMPSDYCYNITNLDPQSDICNGHPRVLEQLKRGHYRYLGENYSYSGEVTHKGIPVGKWVNGKYTKL